MGGVMRELAYIHYQVVEKHRGNELHVAGTKSIFACEWKVQRMIVRHPNDWLLVFGNDALIPAWDSISDMAVLYLAGARAMRAPKR